MLYINLTKMKKNMKFGILKETKTPPDRRTALSPKMALYFQEKFPNVELVVQHSELRTFSDDEYSKLGITLQEDMSDCDVLAGVKEVKTPTLLNDKTYLYFSHTAKKQEYNLALLQEMLKKNIRMVDYEYLTDDKGVRLTAFGHWAGVVGAYNGLVAYGRRSGLYEMKRAFECKKMDDFYNEVRKADLPPIKILITGGGRVANGALETLKPLNLKKVSHEDFLTKTYDEPVYAQLDPWHYVKRKNYDGKFDFEHFVASPKEYVSTFKRYTKVADFFIACHFWDENSPVFMTPEEMQEDDFKIKVIADVSCDIKDPIPSTIRASTIAEPFYGYNPETETECDAWDNKGITVMAVDNLPGELPRATSDDFAKKLIDRVFPSLFGDDEHGIIKRATITKNGKLTEKFSYLQDFAEGKE